MAYDPFEDLHKFQDDVWGQIRLNDVERDIIDTPEYQRLFRTSQLGFVQLVYHTANHTRGAHGIGACRITNRLINRLVDNTKDFYTKFQDKPDYKDLYADFEISTAERALIRLGALGKEGMPGEDMRPELKEIVGLGENEKGEKQQHALQSEDLLFHQLLEICSKRSEKRFIEARRIFEKLTERRVCRPLVIIPGDWAYEKLSLVKPPNSERDFPLRTLAAILDSAYYSPFLLFVCSCIEKYLEGIFDTDIELCSYANKIGNGEAVSDIVEKARNLIPSRVIVWTMPYKQLYKDPAIVVALAKCVGQIDSVIDSNKFPDLSSPDFTPNGGTQSQVTFRRTAKNDKRAIYSFVAKFEPVTTPSPRANYFVSISQSEFSQPDLLRQDGKSSDKFQ